MSANRIREQNLGTCQQYTNTPSHVVMRMGFPRSGFKAEETCYRIKINSLTLELPFRPGQTKKVYAYRLVAAEPPQEEDHPTCLKKELISRMWFEWNDYCGYKNFQVETVDVNDCGDLFLESQLLKEGVRVLYRKSRSKH
ncbi:hypothetical protein KPL71_023179 [Citrus sinensis]|nr:hypothetical protein KPL71_023179 [Citrus sinensis]